MAVAVASSILRTCLGDGPATFSALLAGQHGCVPLPDAVRADVRVGFGYPIQDSNSQQRNRRWLASVVTQAATAAGLVPSRDRTDCLVGTGLGETATLETHAERLGQVGAEDLHYENTVRNALPWIRDVTTVSNACAASGYALALAQDLVESDEADAVVVAGVDTMSRTMLAMIGRIGEGATERLRPFDVERSGVLLGEGAAAVVVTRDRPGAVGRLLATGLSSDAYHETAPSANGIQRAVDDAYYRAGRSSIETSLVVAHGTGTLLNDPTEAAVLAEMIPSARICMSAERGAGPLVTAIKGAVGHLSGAAALANVDVALRSLATGRVPPIVGLRRPIAEAECLRLVTGLAAPIESGLVQVNAFGFGGVNAVTILGDPS